jgi:hypothetical protein
MHSLAKKIGLALRVILEAADDTSWKDPNDPNYDRQLAEDALYHTIGPLTDTPKWAKNWTSDSVPVSGFSPDGPAPVWTPSEVIMAMCGDPKLLFAHKENPRSPRYGNRGGSPLYRNAIGIARKYERSRDKSFIEDIFSNGMLGLLRKMQPGLDERRSPFISFAMREIQGTMQHGVGGKYGAIEDDSRVARAAEDVRRASQSKNPREIRDIISGISSQYQNRQSNDENPGNPYGKYSSRVYQALDNYAGALESGDEDRQEGATNQVSQLLDTILGDASAIRGASTGAGQAISTADRKSSIGIVSADTPVDSESGATIGSSIAAADDTGGLIDEESVKYVLQIALDHDLGSIVGDSPKIQKMALDVGVDVNKAGKPIIGGRLTPAEYRYVLRSLGPMIGTNYPGEGVVRTALDVPREAAGWWSPNEDPEIEPIPAGGQWNSAWKRKGAPQMGSTEIAKEMTDEVEELGRLGIRTARTIKTKVKDGKTVQEAMTKVSVNRGIQSALVKLKIIAHLHQSDFGIGESAFNLRPLLLEHLDQVDKAIIVETCQMITRCLYRSIIR